MYSMVRFCVCLFRVKTVIFWPSLPSLSMEWAYSWYCAGRSECMHCSSVIVLYQLPNVLSVFWEAWVILELCAHFPILLCAYFQLLPSTSAEKATWSIMFICLFPFHCIFGIDWPLTRIFCLYVGDALWPSVLWCCWLGGRKGIRPVKNRVVGCWRGYLSGARCRPAYGPADATATHCLLLQ